jgi:hypothetical protein
MAGELADEVFVSLADDTLQRRVLLGDGPHVGGHALADLVGEHADDRPDRLFGIGGLQRQEEADELVVALRELERLFPLPDLGCDAVQLVIEDIAKALGEDEREDSGQISAMANRIEGAAGRKRFGARRSLVARMTRVPVPRVESLTTSRNSPAAAFHPE